MIYEKFVLLNTGTIIHCTGFEGKKSDLSRIDHIFGSMAGGWNGKIYAVEENRFEDGIWLSDHRLVMADVYIER